MLSDMRREHRSAAAAVQAQARDFGLWLPDDQARALAEAACSFWEEIVYIRADATREMWGDRAYRETLRQMTRHKLLDVVTSRGLIPASLPQETVRYMAGWPGCGNAREVAESAEWDTAQVTLEVPVRKPPADRASVSSSPMSCGSAPGSPMTARR
jgi:hypothetical protein